MDEQPLMYHCTCTNLSKYIVLLSSSYVCCYIVPQHVFFQMLRITQLTEVLGYDEVAKVLDALWTSVFFRPDTPAIGAFVLSTKEQMLHSIPQCCISLDSLPQPSSLVHLPKKSFHTTSHLFLIYFYILI